MAAVGKDGKDDSKRVHMARYSSDLKNLNKIDNEALKEFLELYHFNDNKLNNDEAISISLRA